MEDMELYHKSIQICQQHALQRGAWLDGFMCENGFFILLCFLILCIMSFLCMLKYLRKK